MLVHSYPDLVKEWLSILVMSDTPRIEVLALIEQDDVWVAHEETRRIRVHSYQEYVWVERRKVWGTASASQEGDVVFHPVNVSVADTSATSPRWREHPDYVTFPDLEDVTEENHIYLWHGGLGLHTQQTGVTGTQYVTREGTLRA